jgi:rhodanese-related sulfurtransferase
MPEVILFIKKHILLNVALLVVLFTLILLEFLNQKRSADRLSPAKVTHLMNHDNAKVIDIRSATLFKDGHILGATNIPYATLADKSKTLDKTKIQPIVLVCANGQDSARAAAPLVKEGYNVRILAGGLNAWRDAELPLVKD